MLDILISIGGFLLVLSFLVIIHELGHFLAAKLFGVRVDEFGLGYPPKLRTLFTWQGTEFTLNLTPLGGFVRLWGEERYSEAEATGSKVKQGSKSDSGLFYTKPAWQRIIVLAAGATINFIFGVVAFSVIYTFMGIPEPKTLSEGIIITSISEGSPAQESQLQPGDIITRYRLEEDYQTVTSANEFIQAVKEDAGRTVSLEYLRGEEEPKEKGEVSIYIRTPDETPVNDGALGIGITQETVELITYPWWEMPIRGAWVGLQDSLFFGKAILTGLVDMVSGLFEGVVPSELSGPVGIASEVYKQKVFSGGIFSILNFMAVISINLAIVNLLPIPALDGGRIVVLWLEKVSENILGKPFKPIYEQYANAAGMLFLLALIVLITIKDVGKIFGG